MIPLNKISIKILGILLNSRTSISKSQLSEQLEITLSELEHALTRVRCWLNERNVRLADEKNCEIFVATNVSTLQNLSRELRHLNTKDIILSSDERWKLLVFFLLTQENPTVIKRLQMYLGVSRPTVAEDMNKAEVWLKSYNISLVRRPGYGINLVGDEQKIREVTVVWLLDNLSKKNLQFYINFHKIPQIFPFGLIFEYFDDVGAYEENLNLRLIAGYVNYLENRIDVKLTDNARYYLILLLAVTIERMKNKHFIEDIHLDIKDIENTTKYVEAKRLFDFFMSKFSVTAPEIESRYLALNLLAAKRKPLRIDLKSLSLQSVSKYNVIGITESFLAQVSLYLHPLIRYDQQLIQNLAFHLSPVLIRLKFDLPIRNPLLDQIKLEYRFEFLVARKCASVIEENIGVHIPDDEIGYIVMHLATAMYRIFCDGGSCYRVLLVCGAGIGTVWLLTSKIKKLFPHIVIKDVVSASEILSKGSLKGDVELVITTVQLGELDVPVIEVSPFLDDEEIAQIRSLIESNSCYCHRSVEEFSTGPSIVDLISNDTIRLNIVAESRLEVIDEAAKPLILTGAITNEYIDAIIKTIQDYGPYAVVTPGVCLLHASPTSGINNLCMSLITLRNPVSFGHQTNDPVKVAFVIGTINEYGHINALQQLASLLMDKEKIDSIYKAKTNVEVINILKDHVVSCSEPILN